MSKVLSKIKLNTFSIILSIIAVVAILTWIIPSGAYDRSEVDGRQVVVPGTYHTVSAAPQGPFDVLAAPIQGFSKTAEIIVFLLVIGGVLSVIDKTGAISAGIHAAGQFFQKRPNLRFLFIPLGILLFSLCGATFGMCEEALIFIPIFVPLSLSLGYDSTLGVAIPFVGAGVGFAAAFTNPFTVGIAQGIAQVPLYSGIGYRAIIWVICTTVVITWMMVYARKIVKHPEKSLTYDFDLEKRKELKLSKDTPQRMTRRQKAVLCAFGLGMLWLILGVLKPQVCALFHKTFGVDLMTVLNLSQDGWYITEIAALFLGMGFVCGILGKMGIQKFTDAFFDGVRGMAEIAMLLGFAQAIIIIANNGHILDTLLEWMSGPIKFLHPICASWAAMMLQTIIDFFIPSGSGKAVLTMPILAPLADLIGMTRQTMVLAFQLGGSWLNIAMPTDPITIAAISFARISIGKWIKWVLPLLILMYVLSFIFLIPPYFMKW